VGDRRGLRCARREQRGECIGYDGAETRRHRSEYTAHMGGFWIILVEMAVALAIAAVIVWWTTRK
jgi:hypothetical protein